MKELYPAHLFSQMLAFDALMKHKKRKERIVNEIPFCMKLVRMSRIELCRFVRLVFSKLSNEISEFR